jgi:hypothetical protein
LHLLLGQFCKVFTIGLGVVFRLRLDYGGWLFFGSGSVSCGGFPFGVLLSLSNGFSCLFIVPLGVALWSAPTLIDLFLGISARIRQPRLRSHKTTTLPSWENGSVNLHYGSAAMAVIANTTATATPTASTTTVFIPSASTTYTVRVTILMLAIISAPPSIVYAACGAVTEGLKRRETLANDSRLLSRMQLHKHSR